MHTRVLLASNLFLPHSHDVFPIAFFFGWSHNGVSWKFCGCVEDYILGSILTDTLMYLMWSKGREAEV